MAMFIDYDKENTKDIDVFVKNEMKDYDLPYEYSLEDGCIKVVFLNNELLKDREYLKELKTKLKRDIKPEVVEYYDSLEEEGGDKFINNTINLISTINGNTTYKDLLDNYETVFYSIINNDMISEVIKERK